MKPDKICINEHAKKIFFGYTVVSLESNLRANLSLEAAMHKSFYDLMHKYQENNGLLAFSDVNIKNYLEHIIDTTIERYNGNEITIINNIESLDLDRALWKW